MHPRECWGLVPRCTLIPDLFLTFDSSGRLRLNFGEKVVETGYFPLGMRYCLFSRVLQIKTQPNLGKHTIRWPFTASEVSLMGWRISLNFAMNLKEQNRHVGFIFMNKISQNLQNYSLSNKRIILRILNNLVLFREQNFSKLNKISRCRMKE